MSWRIKVIVPILFLHLLAIPLLMSRYLHFYEESVWEGQRLFAESLMEKVQDEIAIHQMITRGDPHLIVYTLDKLLKSYSFRNLSLYDSKGEVLATAGGNPDHSPASDNRAVIRKTPDGTVMDLTLWLQNRSTCQTCHGTEEKFLGAIQGVYSMAQSDSMLKTARLHTFLFIFFTITVVFLLVYLFLDHFVTQPVHQVMKAFRNVERGQLDTRIDLRRKDEIGTMAHQFNEMVDSLRKARKELESSHREGMVRAEQLATVGEIAAGLAHEVKNPLAGISSALEVIRSEVGEESPYFEVMGQIVDETRRIAGIINQLLNYARPRVLHSQSFEIEAVISDIRAIFSPQCAKKSITFTLKISDDPGSITADIDYLKQIFLNLLQNALQAISSGGEITLEVRSDADDILFLISDTGSGMDEDTLAKIFQPFYTTKIGGTGLGLPIVKRLISDMEGTIHIDSSPGRGTQITVRLPRKGRYEDSDR